MEFHYHEFIELVPVARNCDAQLPKHLPLALHATAVRRSVCARLAVLTIDMVYVRHSHNTWGAFENLLKMWRPAEQAPDFVSPTLLAQLRAAHEATGRRAACPVVEQHAVEGMDKTKAVAKLRRAIASPHMSSCIK